MQSIDEHDAAIKLLIAAFKDISANPTQAVEQLMKRYALSKDEAQAAIQANW